MPTRVSPDFLDSVNEINYLDGRMGLPGIEGLRVLDIGAGCGRLARRMSETLPNLRQYDCIDGVAVSTFLGDYFASFRGLDKARVIPMTEHQSLLDAYDLCVNVHSWAECSLEATRWWLDRGAERQITWLPIVPNNPPELLTTELDGNQKPFIDDVINRGYELVDDRRMVENDEIREFDIHNKFYLFRRSQDGRAVQPPGPHFAPVKV